MSSRQELERRAALLELTTDLVSSATPTGDITYLNRNGFTLLGWDPGEDLSAKRIPDLHPRWAGEFILKEGLPIAMREGVWIAETALLHRDGHEVPVSQVIVAHRDDSGAVVHLSTIMRDIRERKQIEQELRESTEMLQLVLDYIPQHVFWKDHDSVYRGCNRNFAKAAGLDTVEDIVGKTDFDLVWKPEEAEFFRRIDREVMDNDEPQAHVVEPQRQADGKQAWIDTSKIPLHDEYGEVVGLLGMFEDITARRLAEEQLHQNQKLESIGQLAGGIAHDFNNMLTVIRGAAELLALDLGETPGLRELANDILDAAENAAGLTQRLLDFSHKGAHSREAVDVHALVEAAVTLLGRTVDKRIQLTTQLDAEVYTLLGDPSQLQNLILNLGLNARDAMPEGGQLHISTTNVDLAEDDRRVQLFEVRPGPHIELLIRDTGVGMSALVAERVFEPFFTTKAVGAGTGLGLSAVHSAVVDHGGAIDLQTEPGQGTSFRIYLPVDVGLVRASSPAVPHPHGHGRILLVDDEELVRNVGGAMLTSLGYEVTMAEDGVAAIALFEAERASIDLVLLDMVMPKLGGRETLAALRAIDPEVAVVFCSGFTRERVEVEGEGVRGFIKKPYQLGDLARHVAEALDQGPATGSGQK